MAKQDFFRVKISCLSNSVKNQRCSTDDKCKSSITAQVWTCIRIARWGFVCPEKFVFDSRDKGFVMRSSYYRKVVTLSLLCMFPMVSIGIVVQEPWPHSHTNWFLGLILPVSTYIAANVNIILAYFYGRKLLKMLNTIHSIELKLFKHGFPPINCFLQKYSLFGVQILCILAFVCIFMLSHYHLNDATLNIDTLMTAIYLRGEAQFKVVVHLNSTIVEENIGLVTWWGTSKGLFFHFALVFAIFIEAVGDILALTIILGTLILVSAFVKGLDDLSLPKLAVLEISQDFLYLFNCINDSIGWIVFFVCFGNLPFLISNLSSVLKGSAFSQMAFAFYVAIFLCATLPAATCNIMIKHLPTWYRLHSYDKRVALTQAVWKDGSKESPLTADYVDRQFDLMIQEMGIREAGIRGKVFTVTFSFFGQVCGIILTYGVLMYQFQ